MEGLKAAYLPVGIASISKTNVPPTKGVLDILNKSEFPAEDG